MTVANLASPITPFSSTIRPWTSLVCKITVSFSSLLVDSAGADGASVGTTASEVAEVSGTAGLSTGAGVADVAGAATTAELQHRLVQLRRLELTGLSTRQVTKNVCSF